LVSELGTAAAVPVLMTTADRFGPPAAMGVSAGVFAIAFIPLSFVWRAADARSGAA
jgi:hypothetical protein